MYRYRARTRVAVVITVLGAGVCFASALLLQAKQQQKLLCSP